MEPSLVLGFPEALEMLRENGIEIGKEGEFHITSPESFCDLLPYLIRTLYSEMVRMRSGKFLSYKLKISLSNEKNNLEQNTGY